MTEPGHAGRSADGPLKSSQGEMSRFINAAVVSPTYGGLLLSRPEVALAVGYCGELFRLTPEEREWVLSIRATSLVDLAEWWVNDQNREGNGG